MKITATPLSGLLVIESKVFKDERGFFMETFNQRMFREQGLDLSFVQDNVSLSKKGALRGLHYQLPPHAQGKLVRVLQGSVFDVAVDMRKGSPTFGQWFGQVLDDVDFKAIYIPPGFAHGFLVLSETALFHYKCTALYDPKASRGVIWNDAKISIKWPAQPAMELLTKNDKSAPPLDRAENPFKYI